MVTKNQATRRSPGPESSPSEAPVSSADASPPMVRVSAKNNFVTLLIGTLLLVSLLLLGSQTPQQKGPAGSDPSLIMPKEGEAVLLVEYHDGRRRAFTGGVVSGMTVLDAIAQASRAGRFAVETQGNPDGMVWVESLDGVNSGSDGSWKVYREGADLDGRIAVEELQPGDQLELRYE